MDGSTPGFPAAAAANSLQSCPTLCNPIDGSPQGSAVPGILQARTLELVAISFSNVWKWKVKVKSFSHVRLLATPWTAAHQAPLSMGFSRQEYWSGVPLPSPCNEHHYLSSWSISSQGLRWCKNSKAIQVRFVVHQCKKYIYTEVVVRGIWNVICCTCYLVLFGDTSVQFGRRQWHRTPALLPGKIPWTEEPSGPQSMGSLRVGQDWVTSLSLFTFMHWRRKWKPIPVFWPGES